MQRRWVCMFTRPLQNKHNEGLLVCFFTAHKDCILSDLVTRIASDISLQVFR